jgi:hypothetical protein
MAGGYGRHMGVACDSSTRRRGGLRQRLRAAIQGHAMRVLIATDAWHPQVNGVVRTLVSLEQSMRRLGVTTEFLTPDGFPSVPVPTYPGLHCAMPAARS